MEDELHVSNDAMFLTLLQAFDALREVLRQCDVRQDAQVGSVQESQASFPLHLPQLPIGVYNAATEQIPGKALEKVAFVEYRFILEDKVQVLGIVDDYPRRQGRHGDLKSLEPKLTLAFDKPVEELLSGL